VIKIHHKYLSAFCWLFVYYDTTQCFESELLLKCCVACFILSGDGKILNTYQRYIACYAITKELYSTVQEDPENGGPTLLQNIGNYLSFDKHIIQGDFSHYKLCYGNLRFVVDCMFIIE